MYWVFLGDKKVLAGGLSNFYGHFTAWQDAETKCANWVNSIPATDEPWAEIAEVQNNRIVRKWWYNYYIAPPEWVMLELSGVMDNATP